MLRSPVRLILLLASAACLASSCMAANPVLVGGVSEPHGAVSAEAREAALFAVSALNKDAEKRAVALGSASNAGEVQLLEVLSVKTQVVAGVNYFLTLKLAGASNEAPRTVEATVWSRPWLASNSNSGEEAWQLTAVKPLGQ